MRLLVLAMVALATGTVAQAGTSGAPAPDFSRHGDRAAIEYGRAVAYAVDERDESASFDRTSDIAALIFPKVDCIGGSACADEAKSAFAAYLGTALSVEEIAEAWRFLLPRAGLVPPADAATDLVGWRFTRGVDGRIAFNTVDAPYYVTARRERAWQYLRRHRNGERLMAALSLFLASRPDLRLTDKAC